MLYASTQLRALLFCCFDFWEIIHFWFFPLSYSYSLLFLFHTSVQFSSVPQSCPTLTTPWTVACQASLSITNSWSLLNLISIELVMPSTILSSVVPFSSHLQSFPASWSFQMSQFFVSGGQSVGVSASTSVLPMNTQD